jgi:hypothetical protein
MNGRSILPCISSIRSLLMVVARTMRIPWIATSTLAIRNGGFTSTPAVLSNRRVARERPRQSSFECQLSAFHHLSYIFFGPKAGQGREIAGVHGRRFRLRPSRPSRALLNIAQRRTGFAQARRNLVRSRAFWE